MAFLLLLERLSPEERAAFLLHDIFDVSFTEIAGIVDKREDSVRQTVTRARQRVAAERPRFRASIRQQQELAAKFMQAVALRDPVALAGLFLPDAVMINDGGGKVLAALRPIRGAERIARFFLGVTRDVDLTQVNARIGWMNDGVAIIIREGDGTVSIALGLDVRDEHIAAAYGVRNPDKLAHV
jgi:RNA polymerase sigma-70 factor (ECF subfamily)